MPKPHETADAPREFVIRYVVTFMAKDGRRMIGSRQGRCTYATAEEAQKMLDAILTPGTNSEGTLRSVFGDTKLMAVRPCRCYPVHFDPQQYYFD